MDHQPDVKSLLEKLAAIERERERERDESRKERERELERERDEARKERERERDEAKKREQKIERERDEARRERDDARKDRDKALENLQLSTFSKYLQYCHQHLYKSLAIHPYPSSMNNTDVSGKFYPERLQQWKDFSTIQKYEFESIKAVLKDDRLFSPSSAISEMRELACQRPAANEDDIKPFEHVAIEHPVKKVFRALNEKAASHPTLKDLNLACLYFGSHSYGASLPSDDRDTERTTDERQRDRSPNKPKKFHPDRRCIIEDAAGKCSIAYVAEYKAAHYLPVDQVRPILKEDLFETAIMGVNSKFCQPNDEGKYRRILAMALTQTFDYMIRLGLEYSYLTAGKSRLFLRVKADNPTTLCYHLADHDEETAGETGKLEESKTAVAQVACFTLLALRSHARPESWRAKAEAILCKWPKPYKSFAEMRHESTDEESVGQTLSSSGSSFHGGDIDIPSRTIGTRSKSSCKAPDLPIRGDDGNDSDGGDDSFHHHMGSANSTTVQSNVHSKEKTQSSSSNDQSSSGSGNSRSESTSHAQDRSRPYCTLGCINGLKRGWELDAKCPNVASHRLAPGSAIHPIDSTTLIRLVQDYLTCSEVISCEPLEMEGLYGAVGSIFKLSLRDYGYTFIGKGTIRKFIPDLTAEANKYARLEALQGKVVPVVLGSINLTTPYHLTAHDAVRFAGTKIQHMLLMSWAGEAIKESERSSLAPEITKSLQTVRNEGVLHLDTRRQNLLWNRELDRVMVIDFDQAEIVPCLKPKRLEQLIGRKRVRSKDNHRQKRDMRNCKA